MIIFVDLNKSMNPFFKKYNTKYESIPFSIIKTEHYLPAFIEGINQSEKDIEDIVNNNETPNFSNVIESISFSSEMLNRTAKAFFNLMGTNTSDEMQKIAQEVSPLLSKLTNDKILNKALFKKVKYVFEHQKEENLDEEQKMLLQNEYDNFVRNGANLSEGDKETLRELDSKLSNLSLSFNNNVLKETNKFELHLTNKNDLSGLPEGAIEAAAITAKEKGKNGWVFTLDAPSFLPFMSYSDNRELRKKLYTAHVTKALKGDEFDNQNNIKEFVSCRKKRAMLLGFNDHASFVLEKRMASNTKTVTNFIDDLVEKSKPTAIKEYRELCSFSVKNNGPKEVLAYDTSYYVKKLKKEKFDLDDQILKEYFQLENAIKGVFLIAEKLYGLQFEEIFDIDKFHPDVQTYKVSDKSGELVSIFYADFFPRESKSSGAWMNSLKSQYIKDGVNVRPHIINVCNFTKPTKTKPSLLTFNELLTLFHEFGHGLHGMLANTKYKDLSGTNVYRDFVELPSQLLENWCYEKEALSLFAFHYKTGKIIPDELIEKIIKASNFREASAMLRQLSLGILDMAYHVGNVEINDVRLFENESIKNTIFTPQEDYGCISSSFSHIFAGGYSAGYYSYKWAEVLDADAFEHFKKKGIFNNEVGEKFKETILSKGGTKHPMELYKDFRGTEPDTTALLKRAGL